MRDPTWVGVGVTGIGVPVVIDTSLGIEIYSYSLRTANPKGGSRRNVYRTILKIYKFYARILLKL